MSPVARTQKSAKTVRTPHRNRGKFAKKKGGVSRGSTSSNVREMKNKYSWLPLKRKCILPMTELLTLTSSAALNVFGIEYPFRCNSIYRCRFPTGVGWTVNGWNSIQSQYKRYMVYGIKYHVTFFDPTADGLVVGLALSNANDTALAGGLIDVADSKQMYYTKDISNSGTQRVEFSGYFPISKLLGITSLQHRIDTDRYSSAINTDPAQTAYLRVALADTRSAAGTSTVKVAVRMEYYTMLYEKVTDTQNINPN